MSLFTPLSINNVDLPVLSIVYAFGALIDPIVFSLSPMIIFPLALISVDVISKPIDDIPFV